MSDFIDDEYFYSQIDHNIHLIVGDKVEEKKTEDIEIKIEPLEPDYDDLIQDIFLDLKVFCSKKNLDLLENANIKKFNHLMMFFKQ